MSDIDEMLAWLKAQLDDDEAYARNAFGDHNQAEPEWTEIWSGAVQVGPNEDLVLTNDSPISRHMVRHDPARVLREVEAKRRIIDMQEQHDLTDLEMLQAVNQWQANLLKYALRAERHPDDPEKGVDEA